MKKMKRIAAMTAALLICSGAMGYMPAETLKIGGFTAAAAGVVAEESVEINETNFPDENFRQYVAEGYDRDGDGVLSAEEISEVTMMNVSGYNISDLTGVGYFKNLIHLSCQSNQLTSLDVSNNTALTVLWCQYNQLTSIDVSANVALEGLSCDNNQLVSLDISNCTNLKSLRCPENKLTTLDLSNNTALDYLFCENNQLTSLDVNNITGIRELYCGNNKLTTLDLSDNTALEYLFCENNQLTSLDVSKNLQLKTFYCNGNQLTSIDVSNNTILEKFNCLRNQITALVLNKNTALKELYCGTNQFTNLDLSQNTELIFVQSIYNEVEIKTDSNQLNLSSLPGNFDVSKAFEWYGCTVNENTITIDENKDSVSYKYDCGYGDPMTVRLFFVYSPTVSTGDISGDGSIDSSDATLVLSDYAVIATGGKSTFTAEQAKAADVNGDGKYDSIDASLILAYYGYTSTGGTGTIEDYLADMN